MGVVTADTAYADIDVHTRMKIFQVLAQQQKYTYVYSGYRNLCDREERSFSLPSLFTENLFCIYPWLCITDRCEVIKYLHVCPSLFPLFCFVSVL